MKKLSSSLQKLCGVLLTMLLTLAFSAKANSYTWTNTAGGNWNGAANWTPNGVPGGSDSAAITTTGNYTVTNNSPQSIGTLTLGASSQDGTVQTLYISSGTFTVNNASTGTAQGTLSMSGGILAAAGTLTLAGPLNWTAGSITGVLSCNGGTISDAYGLNGGTLINTGTLSWMPYFYDGNGSVISNAASGIMNVALNGQPITLNEFGGSATFYNAGQINVSGAGYSGNIGDTFINTGTVAVNSGTLDLVGGGTNTGAMVVAAGATLQVGNTYSFNGGTVISGAGIFKVSGGTANFTGAYALTNAVVVSGGTVSFNGSGTVNLANLTLSGGTVAGSIPVLVSGPLNWTAGSITGVLSFNGGTVSDANGLNGGTLINTGTLSWTPYFYDGNGSVISNAAGGIINVALNGQPITLNEFGGSATFYNAGQINVSGAGYSGNIGDTFINTGTVAVNSGTLDLVGGGTNAGAMVVAAGATLQVGSTYSFDGGSVFSGVGSLNFSAGTANFTGAYALTNALVVSGGTVSFNGSGTVNLASLTLSGGTVAGSIPVLVSGPLNWTAGSITGVLSCNGGTISDANGLSGGTLINTGTLSWTPYFYDGNGSVISNAAGGIINVALNGQPITVNEFGGSTTFYNAGQINVSGAGYSGNIADAFINTGTVAVNSGTLDLVGGGTNSGAMVVASGATLQVGSTYNFNGGTVVSGAGIFKVSGGTVSFNGSGTVNLASLTLIGGTVAGSIPVLVSGPLNWTAGSITGVLSFNGGTISDAYGLNGGTLINTGTLSWTPYFYDGNGSVISNAAGGIINVALNNQPITLNEFGGSATFYNAGQINVSGAGYSGNIGDTFINTGTVAVNSGTLDLVGGGTNAGAMVVATGATLQVGSTYNFSGGSVFSGAGIFKVSGGTANFTGAYALTNALVVSGGTASFNGSGTVNLASLTLSGGTVAGSVPVLVSGPLNWTAGSITGVLSFNGGTISDAYGLNGGTLINTGTLSWTPYFYDGNGSVISNAAGGIINVALNGQPITLNEFGGSATFYNAGLINVSGAGYSGTINDNFTNTGTVSVNSGMLRYAGNCSLTNGVLNFGINGSANFGQISLAGNPAPLAGTISANFNSNYFPLVNTAFPLIGFTSSSGAFTNTNLPPAAVWQTAYNPANVTITLLKMVPQLTWANPANIVYGTALSSAQLDATAASPTNLGGTLAGTFSYTPPVGTILNSGSNRTLCVMFTPTDLVDYTNVATNVTINVLQAPLTVTANDLTKTYGQTFTFAGTEFLPTGLVNGDTVTSASLVSVGDPPTAQVSGSPYTITITNAVGDAGLTNYIITYDTGTLTVNPAPLTVTASAQSKSYGQTLNLGTTAFTTTVLSNSDTLTTVTLSSPGAAAAATVAGSPYTITASAPVGTGLGNYSIAFKTGSLTVIPAPLTITASAQSKIYGQTLNLGATAFTTTVLSNSDTLTAVTLSSPGAAATATVAGSPYTITPSAPVGTGLGNYSIAFKTGSLTVTPAPLTITASAQSKIYGQTLNLGTTAFTTTVLSNSDTLTAVTLSSPGAAATATVAGSPYSITPSAAVGSGVGNYTIIYDDGLLTVTLPSLNVVDSPPSMILSWTTNASAFVLNRTPSLVAPITWTQVTTGITVDGTSNTITINASVGNQYYALIAP